MSRPAWRGVVVVVGLVPDDRAMRVIWRFRPADRANCNQSCGVVVARFSRVGQDGRNPWRCWIDLERLQHLPNYQPILYGSANVREIVACPWMHVLGVTAVPGRYSSWMVLNPLKCRVARLNINHSLYQPPVDRCPVSLRKPGGAFNVLRRREEEREATAIDRANNLIGNSSDQQSPCSHYHVHVCFSCWNFIYRFHCWHSLEYCKEDRC